MIIKVSNISYSFDNNGNTTAISTSLSGNDGSDFVNATVVITNDDLQGETLDDLNRKQIQEKAHEKFIKLVSVAPETTAQK